MKPLETTVESTILNVMKLFVYYAAPSKAMYKTLCRRRQTQEMNFICLAIIKTDMERSQTPKCSPLRKLSKIAKPKSDSINAGAFDADVRVETEPVEALLRHGSPVRKVFLFPLSILEFYCPP